MMDVLLDNADPAAWVCMHETLVNTLALLSLTGMSAPFCIITTSRCSQRCSCQHVLAYNTHPCCCICPALCPAPLCPADFFATWCNGCQRSYPEICKVAMDPDIHKEVKFVKVRKRVCVHVTAGQPW